MRASSVWALSSIQLTWQISWERRTVLHKKGQLASTIAARFVHPEITAVEESPDGFLVRPAAGFAVLVRSVWSRGDTEAYTVTNADVTPAPACLGVGRVGEVLY